MGIASLAMLVPAAYALVLDLHRVAQSFFYSAILGAGLTALAGLVNFNKTVTNVARSQLLALVGAFVVLPLMFAIPVWEATDTLTLFDAYFEMVSAFTTTGATLIEPAWLVSAPVHLWRALVGWLGGYFILVVAASILAPLTLGGFEVLRPTRRSASAEQLIRQMAPGERILRFSLQLLPLYMGLTVLLWMALVFSGTDAFIAVCLAMSTLATSGITPSGGLMEWQVSIYSEALIFAFLFFAISRQTITNEHNLPLRRRLGEDREIRIALIIVTSLSLALFLRHWIGALEEDDSGDILAAIRAAWGATFTVMSFLTTTGFESHDWDAARTWSGLPAPGLVLAGLAITGGGVATTAGGVKLLRVYALYKHGTREMERLVHPNSIGGAGKLGREIRREGAFIAWVFFMLFAISIALVILALAFTGLDFETSAAFAIAAFSTTGPLAETALGETGNYAMLDVVPKLILLVAMVLGRLETLAIIALFNPEFWRS